MDATKENVKAYYGKTLISSSDISSGKECRRDDPSGRAPQSVRAALRLVHEDIQNTYYGCALVIPSCVQEATVIDLGSGTGRDCFALSKLVGPDGRVIGVDMTEELLEKARKHVTYHQEKFGYSESNVEFRQGFIENLADAGLGDGIADIIISNCVVCLSTDKPAVLREAHRVLKNGGELFFSDIYVGQEKPAHFKDNPLLWSEGIAGALHWQELVKLAREIGFSTPRLVFAQEDVIHSEELKNLVGNVTPVSATYRLFKIPESTNEDDALVTYTGTLPEYEKSLPFDKEHSFSTNFPMKVDGEMASILKTSRYSKFFKFEDVHQNVDTEVAKRCPSNPFNYTQSLAV